MAIGIKKDFRTKLKEDFCVEEVTNDTLLEHIREACSLAEIPDCKISLCETSLCLSLKLTIVSPELDTNALNHTVRDAVLNLLGQAKLTSLSISTNVANRDFDELRGKLRDEIEIQRQANGFHLEKILGSKDPRSKSIKYNMISQIRLGLREHFHLIRMRDSASQFLIGSLTWASKRK